MLTSIFERAAAQRGSLSQQQETALLRYAADLGRAKFAEYRRRAGVGSTTITRLSRGEAWRLLNCIISDQEAGK